MLKSAFTALGLSLALCAPLAAKDMADHGHGHMAAAELGDLRIYTPAIRATPPAAPAAGGFVQIHNMGDSDDTLIAARIDPAIAGMVQLHNMVMDGDVMRMSEVEGGIVVPAGEHVTLAPGGLHIMFMRLNDPMEAGESHDITLVFAKAGEVTVPFEVLSLGDLRERLGAMEMQHGEGHTMGHGDGDSDAHGHGSGHGDH